MEKKEQKEFCINNFNKSHLLGRINDYISNENLSKHEKIVKIWLLTNNLDDFPKLPPLILPCEITLTNGSKFKAYMDRVYSQDWIEYGNTLTIRINGRRTWKQKDVVKWKFI